LRCSSHCAYVFCTINFSRPRTFLSAGLAGSPWKLCGASVNLFSFYCHDYLLHMLLDMFTIAPVAPIITPIRAVSTKTPSILLIPFCCRGGPRYARGFRYALGIFLGIVYTSLKSWRGKPFILLEVFTILLSTVESCMSTSDLFVRDPRSAFSHHDYTLYN
jgi:hypothetical protein